MLQGRTFCAEQKTLSRQDFVFFLPTYLLPTYLHVPNLRWAQKLPTYLPTSPGPDAPKTTYLPHLSASRNVQRFAKRSEPSSERCREREQRGACSQSSCRRFGTRSRLPATTSHARGVMPPHTSWLLVGSSCTVAIVQCLRGARAWCDERMREEVLPRWYDCNYLPTLPPHGGKTGQKLPTYQNVCYMVGAT